MRIVILLALFCGVLPFEGKSQGNFDFSDTVFVLGQKHRLNTGYLGGGHRLSIDSISIIELDSMIVFLNRNKEIVVEVGAHTDFRGADSMNLKITQMRARSVKNFIVSRGIPEARIIAKGYGETQPIISQKEIDQCKKTDPSKVEELYRINRRIELTITGI